MARRELERRGRLVARQLDEVHVSKGASQDYDDDDEEGQRRGLDWIFKLAPVVVARRRAGPRQDVDRDALAVLAVVPDLADEVDVYGAAERGMRLEPVWKSKFTARSESSRLPPRHRRDACSMAWQCRFLTARPSQDGRVIAEK